jgi:dUTP pyrophosphatase
MRKFHKVSTEQMKKDFKRESLEELEIKLPKRGTKLSAGYDFFAPFDFKLEPNETIKIPTGIKAEMKVDNVLELYTRSSLGFKYFSRLANDVGIVDADYINSKNEGHIFIKIRNEGEKTLSVKKGEAFAQGIFKRYLLVKGDDFENGEDRDGGMGSTNK